MDQADAAGHKSELQTDIISSYLSDWIQVKYFYEQAASIAHEICEAVLARHEIRAIVTHRVKASNRLEAKLRERVRKKRITYRTADDIRNDIVDLAGVRIALYFPSDREKIGDIISQEFSLLESRTFPEKRKENAANDSSSPDYKARFMGYAADHYRVRMKAENLATKRLQEDFQKSNPMIEIQVASVLMHAWAEIDHDLVYKTPLTSGAASDQERRLLDAANGLVRTGEVLLQQLQIAMKGRVAYEKEPFQDIYKLGEFLRKLIKLDDDSLDHLGILLQVLRTLKFNSPYILGKKLNGFTAEPERKDPLDLAILEHILKSLEGGKNGGDSPGLEPRSIVHEVLIEIDFDIKDDKRYLIDGDTRQRVLHEAETLIRAVRIVDILRMPQKSVLNIRDLPGEFRELVQRHNDVLSIANLLNDARQDGGRGHWILRLEWRRNSMFDSADLLWTWFEKNGNIHFRLALLLARLNKPEIATELEKLQRLSNTRSRKTPSTAAIPKLHTSFNPPSLQSWGGRLKRASTSHVPGVPYNYNHKWSASSTLGGVAAPPSLHLRRTESPASLLNSYPNHKKVKNVTMNGNLLPSHDVAGRDSSEMQAEEAKFYEIFNELDVKQVGIITRKVFLEWLYSTQMSTSIEALSRIDYGGSLNRDEFAKIMQYIKKLHLQKTDGSVHISPRLDPSVEDIDITANGEFMDRDSHPRRSASR
jgi:ppGpp synthetase/RelA/SpoT-type nucleotidyltranferase